MVRLPRQSVEFQESFCSSDEPSHIWCFPRFGTICTIWKTISNYPLSNPYFAFFLSFGSLHMLSFYRHRVGVWGYLSLIYFFVRCRSLFHITNTSLRYSNQPLWKLTLMTGENTTKQQMGEIKNNIKSNLVVLKKEMSWKKNVLINSCSESCQGKFSVKILEKYIWRSSFWVKLHKLVPGNF